MKRLTSFLVALFLATATLLAYDFQSGDLYYIVTGKYTVEVTCQDIWYISNYSMLSGEVEVPSQVTYKGVTYDVTGVGITAFHNSPIRSITLPNSIHYISEQAFIGCKNLETIHIPTTVTHIGISAFGDTKWYDNQPNGAVYINDILYKYKGEMTDNTSFAVPENIHSISGGAFANCVNLADIIVPAGVTDIGDKAFAGTTWYNNLPQGEIYINQVLYGYKGDIPANTSLVIKEGTISVTESAFALNDSIISVYIPSSLKSIGQWAFRDCDSIHSFAVSADNPYYSCKDGVLFDKQQITLVQYPAAKQQTTYNIPYSVSSIGFCAFRGNSYLQSIALNNISFIASQAFIDCSALQAIDIPNGICGIGGYTFDWCRDLARITIPNSVQYMGERVFAGCSSLSSIIIPDGVESIGYQAFSNCTNLSSVTCHATIPPYMGAYSEEHDFVFNGVETSLIPLYVPAASVERYRAAEQWKEFDVRPIQDTPTNIKNCIGENIQVAGKSVFCAEPFHIYDMQGREVTANNGNLQGMYIIVTATIAQKVLVP